MDALQLLSNGVGSWFGLCYWCKSPTTALGARDDLRILATAKAAGWSAVRCADGRYKLACRRCQRVYPAVPKVS